MTGSIRGDNSSYSLSQMQDRLNLLDYCSDVAMLDSAHRRRKSIINMGQLRGDLSSEYQLYFCWILSLSCLSFLKAVT